MMATRWGGQDEEEELRLCLRLRWSKGYALCQVQVVDFILYWYLWNAFRVYREGLILATYCTYSVLLCNRDMEHEGIFGQGKTS